MSVEALGRHRLGCCAVKMIWSHCQSTEKSVTLRSLTDVLFLFI